MNRREAQKHRSDNFVQGFLDEIRDSIDMLALRATQVRLLYASRLAESKAEYAMAASLQQQARLVIGEAAGIVSVREKYYRVPWQRIAAWRERTQQSIGNSLQPFPSLE